MTALKKKTLEFATSNAKSRRSLAYLLWFRMCLEKGSEASQGWGRMSCLASRGHKGFMGTRKWRRAICLSCLTCQAMSSNHPRLEGQWQPELWLTLPTPERASYRISSNTALKLPLLCAGFSQERSVKLFFFFFKKKPHFKRTYAFQPQSAKWIMVLLCPSMSLAIF